jgi:hypothetical protein
MPRYNLINGKIVQFTAEEEASFDTHENYENSNKGKLDQIKIIRLQKLKETDWWVLRGEITAEQTAWRKSLRDIPTTYSASDYDSLLEVDKIKKTLKHNIWSKP